MDAVINDFPVSADRASQSERELEIVQNIPTGEQYGIAFPTDSELRPASTRRSRRSKRTAPTKIYQSGSTRSQRRFRRQTEQEKRGGYADRVAAGYLQPGGLQPAKHLDSYFDVGIVVSQWDVLLQGALVTISLALLAEFFGSVLGLILALLKISRSRLLSAPAQVCT